MCYSSVESDFPSYDRTAVYPEVPGESADLHCSTRLTAVTLPYFSRHFTRHCEIVVKLWTHARCAYDHFQVFNGVNSVNQDVCRFVDTFQGSMDRNAGCILSECIARVSDSGFSRIKHIVDSNAAYNTLLCDTFQDSNIDNSFDIVYTYSNSVFESPLGTVLHTHIDNCGLNRPSDNYRCLGMGLPTSSRINTSNYNCMCKGKVWGYFVVFMV